MSEHFLIARSRPVSYVLGVDETDFLLPTDEDLPVAFGPEEVAAYRRGWADALRTVAAHIERTIGPGMPAHIVKARPGAGKTTIVIVQRGKHRGKIPSKTISLLSRGPITKNELYAELKIIGRYHDDAIRTALRRLVSAGRVIFDGEMYALAEVVQSSAPRNEMSNRSAKPIGSATQAAKPENV